MDFNDIPLDIGRPIERKSMEVVCPICGGRAHVQEVYFNDMGCGSPGMVFSCRTNEHVSESKEQWEEYKRKTLAKEYKGYRVFELADAPPGGAVFSK